jgi:hypothetical protein
LNTVVASFFSNGLYRPFCTGYSVFGGAWLLLVISSFEFAIKWEERLVTTDGFNALHGVLISSKTEVYPSAQRLLAVERMRELEVRGIALPDGSYQLTYVRPSQSMFTYVGNALFCIPFGLLGGVIARAFYRRQATIPKE